MKAKATMLLAEGMAQFQSKLEKAVHLAYFSCASMIGGGGCDGLHFGTLCTSAVSCVKCTV